jgi:hypothetical protein
MIALESGGSNGNCSVFDLKIEFREQLQYRVPGRPVSRRLTGYPGEVFTELGHPPMESRQDLGANPGTKMVWVGVGGIYPCAETSLPKIGRQLDPVNLKERSDDMTTDRGHARETCRTRSGKESHENGLGLILGVVGGQDRVSADSDPHRFQPGIPTGPCLALGRMRTQMPMAYLEWKPRRAGEVSNLFCNGGTIRVNPMIEVSDSELQLLDFGTTDQQIQECDGVGAAGYGHDNRLTP